MTLQLFKWDTLEAEFLRLALRTLTAGVCWWLLRDVIESRTVRPEGLTKRPFLISVALLLGAALTMPHPQLSPLFAVLFGVGSIAVALKEEFLFRGVIQNLLQRRFGFTKAVLLTTAIFTAWHYGVVENTRWQFVLIFLVSVAICVIYVRTGNIWVAIALHATFDAVLALPTLVTFKGNLAIAFLMLLGAVGFACFRASSGSGKSLPVMVAAVT
jgi:membrane protease YdiL (CAAX protease family)